MPVGSEVDKYHIENQYAIGRNGTGCRGSIHQLIGHVDTPVVTFLHVLKGCGKTILEATDGIVRHGSSLFTVIAYIGLLKDIAFGIGGGRNEASTIGHAYGVGIKR